MARIDAVLRPHDLTFARFEVLRLLAFTPDPAACPWAGWGAPPGPPGERDQRRPPARGAGLRGAGAERARKQSTIARILDAGRARLEPATADLNELFESTRPRPTTSTASIDSLRRVARRGGATGDEGR